MLPLDGVAAPERWTMNSPAPSSIAPRRRLTLTILNRDLRSFNLDNDPHSSWKCSWLKRIFQDGIFSKLEIYDSRYIETQYYNPWLRQREPVALAAADFGLKTGLGTVDSIIYATARRYGAESITSGHHFR